MTKDKEHDKPEHPETPAQPSEPDPTPLDGEEPTIPGDVNAPGRTDPPPTPPGQGGG